jgi:hypothetical protein
MDTKEQLIRKLKIAAMAYKKSFEILQMICENNPELHGAVNQTQEAILILQGKSNSILIDESMKSGNDLLKMEKYAILLEQYYSMSPIDTNNITKIILNS